MESLSNKAAEGSLKNTNHIETVIVNAIEINN